MLTFSAIFFPGCWLCFGSHVLQSVRREFRSLTFPFPFLFLSFRQEYPNEREEEVSSGARIPSFSENAVLPVSIQDDSCATTAAEAEKESASRIFSTTTTTGRLTISFSLPAALENSAAVAAVSFAVSLFLSSSHFPFVSIWKLSLSLFLCPCSWIESRKERVLLEHTLLEQREAQARTFSSPLFRLISNIKADDHHRRSIATTTTTSNDPARAVSSRFLSHKSDRRTDSKSPREKGKRTLALCL